MIIKICGLQTVEDAQFACAQGAQFIGFVFAPSKRRVTPEQAKKIVMELPSTSQAVGVFVNESVETMLTIAKDVGLDLIQLHGNEPASVAEQLPYPVIKAFSIDEIQQKQINDYPCAYYLIDSPGGGTGESFQWERLATLPIQHNKLLLAGGLHPGNVENAIRTTLPAGVDVSSGVETNGYKDQQKILQFITTAFHTGKEVLQ